MAGRAAAGRCSPAAPAEPPGCGRWSRCGRRPVRPWPGGTHYRLSAWLGGTARSRAAVTVAFLSAAGRVLARRAIGPVGRLPPATGLVPRAATGTLPRGHSQRPGHAGPGDIADQHRRPGRAVRGLRPGGCRCAAVHRLRPGPPAPAAHPARLARSPLPARVPLLLRERGLSARSSATPGRLPTSTACCPGPASSASFFAEEHPSDGNYLALAGGSTFGIPLDDPLEENPQYTIHARNIGDLIDARARDVEGLPAERGRPVRRHGARGLLGRRPADDLLRRRHRTGPPTVRPTWSRSRHCRPTWPARPPHRTSPGSAPTTAPTWRGAGSGPGTSSWPASSAPSCARRPGGPSGRWPSSPSTRTATTTSTRPSACRPSSSGRPASGRATCRTSATRTTACSAPSRARWASGTLTGNDLYAQPANDVSELARSRRAPAQPASAAAARPEPPPAAPGLASGPALTAAGRKPARAGVARPVAAPPAADRLRGELRLELGHAHRPGHPAGGQADQGREAPAGHRHHARTARPPTSPTAAPAPSRPSIPPPGRRARRSRWAATRRRSRSPRTARPPTWPTPAPAPSRPSTWPPGGRAAAIKVGTAPAGDRHHPGRPDRLRARLGQRRGDADRHGHQPGRAADPGRAATPTRSRSRRTAAPPTSPATARTRVTPITVATGRPGRPIPVGQAPDAARRHPRQHRRSTPSAATPTPSPRSRRPPGGRAAGIPVGYSPAAIADLPLRQDGVRGQYDLRHGDAGQHRDRPGAAVQSGSGSTPTQPPSPSPRPAASQWWSAPTPAGSRWSTRAPGTPSPGSRSAATRSPPPSRGDPPPRPTGQPSRRGTHDRGGPVPGHPAGYRPLARAPTSGRVFVGPG